jgi:hypothetical protein
MNEVFRDARQSEGGTAVALDPLLGYGLSYVARVHSASL